MGVDSTFPILKREPGSNLIVIDAGTQSDGVWSYLRAVGEKTNFHFRFRIDRPFRPRTTGYRSQSARFHGHCEDIAIQLVIAETGRIYSPEEIADAFKRMAVEYGYPTHLSVDGIEVPNSEADLSLEQESILLKVQQRYADIHGFWTTEYSQDGKHTYRSVGGRTEEEMGRYWKHGTKAS